MNKQISFIGAGNMAEGIMRGIVNSGLCPASNIRIFDVLPGRMEQLRDSYGVVPAADARQAIELANIVFISVLPKHAPGVMAQIREFGHTGQFVVSVCAGITIEQIAGGIGADRRIGRVMPNTLIEAQCGYSALCVGEHATDEDKADLDAMFQSIGQTMFIDESLFDAWTAFACTGPEYLLYYYTALMDAGVQSGFSRQQARDITIQNCIGTARMLEATGLHPYALSDTMSSPAGCGIEGLSVLYKSQTHGVLMEAVRAALRRTIEMGRGE